MSVDKSEYRPFSNFSSYSIPSTALLQRDTLTQLTVETGDTYWSLAKLVVSLRKGCVATSLEVKRMVREMAHYNGKTECDAARIRPGDIIKVPPERAGA